MIYNLSNDIDKNKATCRMLELVRDGKTIELTEKKKKRTIKQNAYYHVLINLCAIEFGNTFDEQKIDLKRECPFMRYEKKGNTYLKRTRDLTTKELTDFIDWIRNYIGKTGLYLPSAEDYLINQFEIDKEINNQKQYM